jgi:hypothetical protein
VRQAVRQLRGAGQGLEDFLLDLEPACGYLLGYFTGGGDDFAENFFECATAPAEAMMRLCAASDDDAVEGVGPLQAFCITAHRDNPGFATEFASLCVSAGGLYEVAEGDPPHYRCHAS